jgi:uncharacterized protein YlxW (UPF0749 family)
MITCCEIALALSVTNIVSLAVFAEYTIRLKAKQIKLEKKNGHEQDQINRLQKQIQQLEKRYEQR